jgi:hypothetical protein
VRRNECFINRSAAWLIIVHFESNKILKKLNRSSNKLRSCNPWHLFCLFIQLFATFKNNNSTIMKQLLSFCMAGLMLVSTTALNAQADKSKRPSPPAKVSQKVGSTTITIDYSQPSVKGRTIGKNLEPKTGEVWRTGANEATTFEVDNDVMIEGKKLPKGKYALFTIMNGNDWTIILNKTANQWGAYEYSEAQDAVRVNVKSGKADPFAEKFTITISAEGKVTLHWGDYAVSFNVQ